MVPGVLALVHRTFVHPGVACITLLVQGKYSRPTLARDVREVVLRAGGGEGRGRVANESS